MVRGYRFKVMCRILDYDVICMIQIDYIAISINEICIHANDYIILHNILLWYYSTDLEEIRNRRSLQNGSTSTIWIPKDKWYVSDALLCYMSIGLLSWCVGRCEVSGNSTTKTHYSMSNP